MNCSAAAHITVRVVPDDSALLVHAARDLAHLQRNADFEVWPTGNDLTYLETMRETLFLVAFPAPGPQGRCWKP